MHDLASQIWFLDLSPDVHIDRLQKAVVLARHKPWTNTGKYNEVLCSAPLLMLILW